MKRVIITVINNALYLLFVYKFLFQMYLKITLNDDIVAKKSVNLIFN